MDDLDEDIEDEVVVDTVEVLAGIEEVLAGIREEILLPEKVDTVEALRVAETVDTVEVVVDTEMTEAKVMLLVQKARTTEATKEMNKKYGDFLHIFYNSSNPLIFLWKFSIENSLARVIQSFFIFIARAGVIHFTASIIS